MAAISARGFFRKLFIITMLYASLAVVFNTPSVGALINFGPELYFPIVSSLLLVILPVILVIDYLALRLTYRPLGAGLTAIEQGRATPQIIQQTLQHTLNFPAITVGRILTFHLGAAYIALLIYNYLVLPQLPFYAQVPYRFYVVDYFIVPVIAITHAIIEYFAVSRAIRPVAADLFQRLGPQADISRLRLFPVTLRVQLVSIVVWITLLPMILIATSLVIRLMDLLTSLGITNPMDYALPFIGWSAVIILFCLVTVLVILYELTGDLQQRTRTLMQAMALVRQGVLGQPLAPISTDEFNTLYLGFNTMTEGLRERERLHEAFGRYVSPELAEQVSHGDLSFEGQSRQASVLFCDIRNYTATTANMDARDVVTWLNDYFARIEPLVKAHGGWINKFLGDGFMALFGVPVPTTDHAQHAVQAAKAIQQATAEFNAQHPQRPPIQVGIGIAGGEMVSGSIGSPDRLEYTVIGTPVNVAARIEALNKEFGTQLLVSEDIYRAVPTDDNAQAMPPTQVKGVAEPIRVYALG